MSRLRLLAVVCGIRSLEQRGYQAFRGSTSVLTGQVDDARVKSNCVSFAKMTYGRLINLSLPPRNFPPEKYQAMNRRKRGFEFVPFQVWWQGTVDVIAPWDLNPQANNQRKLCGARCFSQMHRKSCSS